MFPIKVGIIGFGLSGKVFHGRLLKQLDSYEVVSIFSSREEEIKSEFPNARIEKSWKSLVEYKELDLVIITSPNEFHFEQVIYALEQGKHVLVEKPITTSLEKTIKLVELAKQKKRVLCTFQNRRFDDDFLTIKEILKNTTPKSYTSHFHRYRPELDKGWRYEVGEARGVFWDLAPHLLDQVLVLFGLPVELKAELKIERGGGTEIDYFFIELKYEKLQVVVQAGSLVKDPEARFEVVTNEGVFQSFEMDPQENQLRGVGSELVERKMSYLTESKKEIEFTRKDGNYLMFYNELESALQGEGVAPVSVGEILDLMHLMEASIKSSRLKSFVKMSNQKLKI